MDSVLPLTDTAGRSGTEERVRSSPPVVFYIYLFFISIYMNGKKEA
jgi:hypothetical protein